MRENLKRTILYAVMCAMVLEYSGGEIEKRRHFLIAPLIVTLGAAVATRSPTD